MSKLLSPERLEEIRKHAGKKFGWPLELLDHIAALSEQVSRLIEEKNKFDREARDYSELRLQAEAERDEALADHQAEKVLCEDIFYRRKHVLEESDRLAERVERLRDNLVAVSTGCTGRDTDASEYADIALAEDDKLSQVPERTLGSEEK